MKVSIIQQTLCKKFSSLGQIIALHPFHFILTPVITSLLLLTGLFRMRVNRDNHYLFTAQNGIADQTGKLIERTFPINTSKSFDQGRIINTDGVIILQITPKDDGSIFRESILTDILTLDSLIRNISIYWKNSSHEYESLCAKKEGSCFKNNLKELAENYKQILRGKYKIKYPIDISNFSYTFREYAFSLGGVELSDYGYVRDAKAMRVIYPLDVSDERKKYIIGKWKDKIYDILQKTKFDDIRFSIFSKEAIINELQSFTRRLLPFLPFVLIVILSFSLISSMTTNCVRSKPWLGISACISAALAVMSGFGLVFHVGVEYTDYVIFLVYSILVLEIDDAYVLIAAWRRTNPEDKVEKRMSDSFYEAGVSVTVTSLTNFTSFCVGIASPFPIIRNFCIYGAASMFFTYVYQITFFGGCMALSGYREQNMIHPFSSSCRRSKRKYIGSYNSSFHKEFPMRQFGDKLGDVLTLLPVKILVTLTFITNLTLGLYGLWYVKSGNDIDDMFSYDSEFRFNFVIQRKHFNNFHYPFHILISRPLNYADKSVQSSIDDFLQKLEALPNIVDSSLTVSWLKFYKQFTGEPIGKFLLRGYNVSNKQDFIDGLRDVFLKFPPAQQFKKDIAFNDNNTEIIASRFLLVSKDISNSEIELKLAKDVIRIANSSPLQVKIYSLNYRYLEQNIIINQQAMNTGAIAASLVFLISFIFLPNIIFALCVSSVVCCVIFEVIGYMSFWNVKIDLIFLFCFVLSIGFAVNHPTHIGYSFITSKNLHPNEMIKKSISELGYPILQGFLSTVLGIMVIAFQPFYVSLAGVKLICLFGIQTTFHSLFVIPVFLSILTSIKVMFCRKLFGSRVEFTEADEIVSGEKFMVET